MQTHMPTTQSRNGLPIPISRERGCSVGYNKTNNRRRILNDISLSQRATKSLGKLNPYNTLNIKQEEHFFKINFK